MKIPGTVLNKIFLIFQMQHNFIKEQIFERETMTSKNTAKFKDYTLSKWTISGFFLPIKLCIKIILATTEYCNS